VAGGGGSAARAAATAASASFSRAKSLSPSGRNASSAARAVWSASRHPCGDPRAASRRSVTNSARYVVNASCAISPTRSAPRIDARHPSVVGPNAAAAAR
jgi:hypothetical protein